MGEQLVSNFKSGHRDLLLAINEVQESLRSYPKAKPRLRDFHEILVSHFGRQDEALYDRLHLSFIGDRSKEKIIEFLSHDLKEVKIKCLLFYDQHSGELADNNYRNFARDFQQFLDSVVARVKVEEEYLFPLLEKLAE